MDTALVCMSCNAVIRNTDSYPHCSFHTGTLTDHFHDPGFIRIGDGERFTTAVITILLHEICHHLDGFLRSTRTLQSYIDQASVVHDTGSIHQFRTPAESRLTDSKLKFVHIADNVVGLARLLYLTEILAGVPLVHINQCAFLVHACGIMIQLAKQSIGVGRIGNNCRTVRRYILTYNKIGAGKSVCHNCHYQHDGES